MSIKKFLDKEGLTYFWEKVKTYIDNSIPDSAEKDGNGNVIIDTYATKSDIADLDATVGSTTIAENKHVAVQVVEENGKLTGLTVTESDIASASDVEENYVAKKDISDKANTLDAIKGNIVVSFTVDQDERNIFPISDLTQLDYDKWYEIKYQTKPQHSACTLYWNSMYNLPKKPQENEKTYFKKVRNGETIKGIVKGYIDEENWVHDLTETVTAGEIETTDFSFYAYDESEYCTFSISFTPVDVDSTKVIDVESLKAVVDTLKQGSVSNADTATKATQDASGNVITETYATKEELENAGKVKTVNGNEPDANGNIEIESSGVATVNSQSPDEDGNIVVETDDGEVAVSDINNLFSNLVTEEDEAANPSIKLGIVKHYKNGVLFENGEMDINDVLTYELAENEGYSYVEMNDETIWLKTKTAKSYSETFRIKNLSEYMIAMVISYYPDYDSEYPSDKPSFLISYNEDSSRFNNKTMSYVRPIAQGVPPNSVTTTVNIPAKGYVAIFTDSNVGPSSFIIKYIKYSYIE